MQQLVEHIGKELIKSIIIFCIIDIQFFPVFGEHELLEDMIAVVVDDDEVGRREERFHFSINSLLDVASW